MDKTRSLFWQALLLIAMLAVSPAHGVEELENPSPNETWLGVGTGGEFDDVSVSLGTQFLHRWGLLVASTHNQGLDDGELVDGPAPVTNITVIDEDARTSPTYGIEGTLLHEFGIWFCLSRRRRLRWRAVQSRGL